MNKNFNRKREKKKKIYYFFFLNTFGKLWSKSEHGL
jgi:hypothetical protein